MIHPKVQSRYDKLIQYGTRNPQEFNDVCGWLDSSVIDLSFIIKQGKGDIRDLNKAVLGLSIERDIYVAVHAELNGLSNKPLLERASNTQNKLEKILSADHVKGTEVGVYMPSNL